MKPASSFLCELQNIKYDVEMSITKLLVENKEKDLTVTIKDVQMKPAIKDVNRRRSLIFTDGKSGILASRLSVEKLADIYGQIEEKVTG